MSHHFDTPTAIEDPRINVCDFYLFRGRPGTTVMALTVNPNAGVGTPDTFRDEGLYAFRFDTNRDLREDVAFKVQFGAPAHADGGEHRHVQTFEVRRATGADALKGAAGELIISGNTGRVVKAHQGCLAYAGLAPDLFASDGAGFGAFIKTLWSENRFAPEAFQNRQNFFGGKNVTAIVLEVPSSLIGQGVVQAWGHRIALRARAGGAGIALGPADDHPHPALRSFAGRRIGKLQPRGPGGRSGAVLQTDPRFRGKSHRARPLSGRPIRLRYATPCAPLPIGPAV